jgi:type II secretory pathway pseudopilin PulG
VVPWLALVGIVVALVVVSVTVLRGRQQQMARELAAAEARAAAQAEWARDQQQLAAANPGFSLPAEPETPPAEEAPPSTLPTSEFRPLAPADDEPGSSAPPAPPGP